MSFFGAIRPLLSGVAMIAAASGMLLFSDWGHRSGGRAIPHIAIVQHASQAALDEGVEGMIDALAAHGFISGKTAKIQRFNSENDLATANAIAKQVTGGDYDLILTSSTISMQTVANANKAGKTRHVFGITADPFSAGIGVTRENPADHPKHLTGIGSMAPVEKALQLAKELYPPLKTVGLAWNSAESNSLAFTKATRAAATKLGLTLLEANADSSSAVGEAAESLVSRGAQALFLTGDVTVLVAADQLVAAGRKGRIPTVSIIPGNVKKGGLFDLGANFYQTGFEVGELAAKVLNGLNPGDVPVRNMVIEKLAVNRTALANLRDPWQLPADLIERASIVVDESGVHDKAAKAKGPKPGQNYKLGLVYFAPEEGNDNCLRGIFDGLKQQGFVEGQNLEVRRSHAQGEISNIPSLMQNYDNQDVDMILAMTTPCLSAACAMVKKKPVVFTYVYDPIAAGAGKTRQDHLPFVTGVGSFPPVGDTIDVIRKVVPGVKVVGTLYNSSEANSRKVISVGRELFAKAGIRLEEVTITSTSEIYQAAQAVTQRGIQAMWVTGDNTALQGFDALVKAVNDAKLPLIINDPEFTDRGAAISVGLGWYEAGNAASKLVARVLSGESPAAIPIEEVAVKKVVVNDDVVRRLKLNLPPDLLKEAGHVTARK